MGLECTYTSVHAEISELYYFASLFFYALGAAAAAAAGGGGAAAAGGGGASAAGGGAAAAITTTPPYPPILLNHKGALFVFFVYLLLRGFSAGFFGAANPRAGVLLNTTRIFVAIWGFLCMHACEVRLHLAVLGCTGSSYAAVPLHYAAANLFLYSCCCLFKGDTGETPAKRQMKASLESFVSPFFLVFFCTFMGQQGSVYYYTEEPRALNR